MHGLNTPRKPGPTPIANVATRVAAGAAAAVLTLAVLLYAPIAVTTSEDGMAVRTHVLLAVLAVSAVSTWMLAVRRGGLAVRFVVNLVNGFNVIWLFSFVGLPVVVASLVAMVIASLGPRRLVAPLVAASLAGLATGLLLLRLTAPPGEHIFG